MGMNGNVREWLETEAGGVNTDPNGDRLVRGDFWSSPGLQTSGDPSDILVPNFSGFPEVTTGFRIALDPNVPVIPEPSSIILFTILLGSSVFVIRKRRA